jgi:hypothetical protein
MIVARNGHDQGEADDDDDDDDVSQVGDQKTVLHAYFNVCSKRVMDNVCMVIETKLLQAVPDLITTRLVESMQCRDEVSGR